MRETVIYAARRVDLQINKKTLKRECQLHSSEQNSAPGEALRALGQRSLR